MQQGRCYALKLSQPVPAAPALSPPNHPPASPAWPNLVMCLAVCQAGLLSKRQPVASFTPKFPAVLRNMSHGYKHQAGDDAESMPAPKRRPRPSPAAGALGAATHRGSEAGEVAPGSGSGGADERSVVELETDADGMDDGYRWAHGNHCLLAGLLVMMPQLPAVVRHASTCSSSQHLRCAPAGSLKAPGPCVCSSDSAPGGANTDRRSLRATHIRAATISAPTQAAMFASRWSAVGATRACWSPRMRARTPTTLRPPAAACAQAAGAAAFLRGGHLTVSIASERACAGGSAPVACGRR